jgi:hypothetical protein
MFLILLLLVAIYCASMWGWLAYRTFKYNEQWEVETFHLGLCFTIAIGVLYLGD